MAEKVSKLSVILSLDSTKFERALGETEKKMKNVGRQLSQVGQDMTIGLSLPLAMIGRQITQTATDFEYQMARVAAISGSTGNQFGKLTANAERLGAATIFTAREVGQLSEEFAKLGFTADEIIKVTESTLSLAQVTGASLPRAAEVSGAALRTFGLEADKVGQVNDVVAVAISKSALDFESFAETMKYAGSQAQISGVSLEELSAAMGVLANTGVKGSIAGTRLRMIFAKLSQEGGNVHDKFIELINSNLTMNQAIERFGIRAATAIPVLQQNREEFFKLEKQMRLSSGTLAIMQETMDDTSFAMQRKLKSALEDVSIQMGKALLPMVNAVAQAFIYLANGFASLPTFIHGAVVAFGAIVAAAGPLLLVTGKLLQIIPSLALVFPRLAGAIAFLASPTGLAIAAVAALGLALYQAYKPAEDLATLSERMGEAERTAAENTVENASKIRLLVDAYKNENRTLEEKQDILDKLHELQPDYFGELQAGKTTVDELKTAYDQMFESMLKTERAKAFMAEINKLEQQRVEALIRQDEVTRNLASARTKAASETAASQRYASSFGGVKNDFMFAGSGKTGTATAADNLVTSLENDSAAIQTEIDNIEAQGERLQALMTDQGMFELLTGTRGKGGGGGVTVPTADASFDLEDEDGQSKALNKLSASLAEAQMKASVFGDEFNLAKENLKAYEAALGSLITAGAKGEDVAGSIQFVMEEMAELNKLSKEFEQSEDLAEALKKMDDALASTKLAFDEGAITPLQNAKNEMKAVKSLIDELSSEFEGQEDTIASLKDRYAELTEEVKRLTEEERKQKLEQKAIVKGQEALVQGSMQVGQALGAVAASGEDAGKAMLEATTGVLSGLITQLYLLYAKSVMTSKTIPDPFLKLAALGVGAGVLSGFIGGIPKMAKGGIAVGEQIVTVGDNRSGREAIIPLERLPSIMSKMNGGSTRVYGSIRGEDIHLSNMRGARMQQRII